MGGAGLASFPGRPQMQNVQRYKIRGVPCGVPASRYPWKTVSFCYLRWGKEVVQEPQEALIYSIWVALCPSVDYSTSMYGTSFLSHPQGRSSGSVHTPGVVWHSADPQLNMVSNLLLFSPDWFGKKNYCVTYSRTSVSTWDRWVFGILKS